MPTFVSCFIHVDVEGGGKTLKIAPEEDCKTQLSHKMAGENHISALKCNTLVLTRGTDFDAQIRDVQRKAFKVYATNTCQSVVYKGLIPIHTWTNPAKVNIIACM